VLKISSLKAGYDETMVLNNVHLEVEKGKVVSILGRNGAGKTTLIKTIIGLLKPMDGTIYWNDQEITHELPERRAKKGIGYVPQGREIFSSLTVEENLILGFEAVSKKIEKTLVLEGIFELFPVLKEMLKRKGGDLSGGQQQQLAIARALAGQPELLLLDEPMEGIQPSIVEQIQEVIVKIASEKGIGVVLVEHSIDSAFACSDEYYILDKRTVVSKGVVKNTNIEDIQQYLVV